MLKKYSAFFLFACVAKAGFAQVFLYSFARSEFYPDLSVTKNDRSFVGSVQPNGFHFAVTKDLEVRSSSGQGYAIQGDVQYFRVGSQPVLATSVSMGWSGTHHIAFDHEPANEETPLSMDVRLVWFDDVNSNHEWNAGEAQVDFTPALLMSTSLHNSEMRSVVGEAHYDGPVLLPPGSYFFGGSATFNIGHMSSGSYFYGHQGTQKFDVTFTPVAEPSTFLTVLLSGILVVRKRGISS